ncbi:MAG: glycosyltransferase family 2 protein [Prevotella sp.]|nr:glycosyltransferase family 2 protein [Prevotella sp.]
MKYKVSIIIPAYNVAQYIERCLDSVVNQTVTEGIECIIIDDCGPDNSLELAEQYVQRYQGNIKFHILRHERNKGLSGARNTGIAHAAGRYLYFLDSDDEITPNCMELMLGLIEKYGEVDLVQGSFFENQEEFRTPSPYEFPEHTCDRKRIKAFLLQFKGDIVGAQSRLIRRDFLYEHNLMFKEGIIHEDNHWTFFLSKHVKDMVFCPVRTYFHRYNPTSITVHKNINKETHAFSIMIKDFSANIDDFMAGYQKELILNTLIFALNNHYYADDNHRKLLIDTFSKQNTFIEKFLLRSYISINNNWLKTKVLHLLIRIYKLKDL